MSEIKEIKPIENLGCNHYSWEGENLNKIQKCMNSKHNLQIENKGTCLTKFTCKECNISWEVDSSD